MENKISEPLPRNPPVHTVGGFSLDAALYADGSIETERLGGNALWAALGILATGGQPIAHSVVGRSYPNAALTEIDNAGVDVSHVRRGTSATGLRVSYSYAPDGTRTQPADPSALAVLPQHVQDRFLDTTRGGEGNVDTLPTVTDLALGDTVDDSARHWHLGLLPVGRCTELADHLAQNGQLVQSDCPARNELRDIGVDSLAELLPLLNAFLPSTSDTSVFRPGSSPDELITIFHQLGAKTVVLKCGSAGALLSESVSGPTWHIPIYPEPRTVDPTGCGDVFAGGFLTARARGEDLLTAVCTGTAAASFASIARKPLELTSVDPSQIASRAQILRKDISAS